MNIRMRKTTTVKCSDGEIVIPGGTIFLDVEEEHDPLSGRGAFVNHSGKTVWLFKYEYEIPDEDEVKSKVAEVELESLQQTQETAQTTAQEDDDGWW